MYKNYNISLGSGTLRVMSKAWNFKWGFQGITLCEANIEENLEGSEGVKHCMSGR